MPSDGDGGAADQVTDHYAIEVGEHTVTEVADGVYVKSGVGEGRPSSVPVAVETADGTLDGGEVEVGMCSIFEPEPTGPAVAISHTGDALAVTVGYEGAASVFSMHQRNRGGIPELNPPAEPRQHAVDDPPDVPRALDRSLGEDGAREMLAALRAQPLGYALTFPETCGQGTYLRAVRLDDLDGHEFDATARYVAVREPYHGSGWERRFYEREDFQRRLLREPAVRLVHKEDAPDALYPEVYRSDDG